MPTSSRRSRRAATTARRSSSCSRRREISRRTRTGCRLTRRASPVPMAVGNWIIRVDEGRGDSTRPTISVYPQPGAPNVFEDAVVKAAFSEPVSNLDNRRFTLADAAGARVPASVHQIGDGTWGLFPNRVFLNRGETYTARITGGVCGLLGNCTTHAVAWTFTVTTQPGAGTGDTTIPLG